MNSVQAVGVHPKDLYLQSFWPCIMREHNVGMVPGSHGDRCDGEESSHPDLSTHLSD